MDKPKITDCNYHKINTTELLTSMDKHSNENMGRLIRLWCTLAENTPPWVIEGNVDMWCEVLKEGRAVTRAFLNYLNSNIKNMKVERIRSKSSDSTFRVTEIDQMPDNSLPTKPKRTKKMSNREDMKDEFLAKYHPSKSFKQTVKFDREYNKRMAHVGNPFNTDKEKVEAEKIEHEKIMSYLEWFSKTDDWLSQDGKYVPLPSTFIEEKGWLKHPLYLAEQQKKKSKTEVKGDVLLDDILDEIEG